MKELITLFALVISQPKALRVISWPNKNDPATPYEDLTGPWNQVVVGRQEQRYRCGQVRVVYDSFEHLQHLLQIVTYAYF